MENLHIGLLFYGNFVITALVYLYLLKNKKLIGFQLGMNISMVIGGMVAVNSGVLLITQFPFSYTIVTIISAVIGIVIGGVVGALFDYQTFLTGYVNGLMMGIMAPMIGGVVQSNIFFIIFIELLLLSSIVLVLSSIKRS